MGVKAFAAALPGPALLFAGEWLDLFAQTGLASPEWQVGAHRAALAVGAFSAFVLSTLLRKAAEQTLVRVSWVLFALTVAGLAGCWGIWFHLGAPSPGGLAVADPAWWRDAWRLLYVVTLVLLVSTVAVASLTVET